VLVRAGVEGVDLPVAEVSDEQVTAKEPEVGRSEREPPRRVELFLRGDAAEQLAVGVEGVHEPVPPAGHVVMLERVLQRVSHIDDTAERSHIPGPGS